MKYNTQMARNTFKLPNKMIIFIYTYTYTYTTYI